MRDFLFIFVKNNQNMNKKLVINCNSKYRFIADTYLNNSMNVPLIFSENDSERFKKDIKSFIDEYIKHIDFSISGDKMILDNYEIVELYFIDTDEDVNTEGFELVNIDLICEGYHVEFILELDN